MNRFLKHARFIYMLLVVGLLLAFPATASAQVPDPGSWVDDLTQDIEFMVDGLWYDVLHLLATVQWFLMRVMVIAGIIVELVTDFIAEQAFAPLIVSSQGQFGVAVTMGFTIAMFVLGLSYMIAHFIRLQVVDLRSALVWYALASRRPLRARPRVDPRGRPFD